MTVWRDVDGNVLEKGHVVTLVKLPAEESTACPRSLYRLLLGLPIGEVQSIEGIYRDYPGPFLVARFGMLQFLTREPHRLLRRLCDDDLDRCRAEALWERSERRVKEWVA